MCTNSQQEQQTILQHMNMARGDQKIALLNRGLLLEYVTLAWNVVGTIIVVVAGIKARSVALAASASTR
jgi:hypothetical protein